MSTINGEIGAKKDFSSDIFEAEMGIKKIQDGLILKKKKDLEGWLGKKVLVTFKEGANVPNGLLRVSGTFTEFSYGAINTDVFMELGDVKYFRATPMLGNKRFQINLYNIETVELV